MVKGEQRELFGDISHIIEIYLLKNDKREVH